MDLKKMILGALPLVALWGADTQEPDHLALATMMIYDGKYAKAERELKQVSFRRSSIDQAKYFKIKAVLALKQERYEEAVRNFLKAIEATRHKAYTDPEQNAKKHKQKKYLFSIFEKHEDTKSKQEKRAFDPEALRKADLEQLYMQLSQAYYKANHYLKAVDALNKAGEAGRSQATFYAFRADCYWKSDKKNQAITILDRGIKRFGNDTTLLRQKFYYLADMKLYQAAIDAAKTYMKRSKATPKEYLALAQVLVSGNQKDEAVKVLEEAAIRFPEDALIKVFLGSLYLKKGMPYVAASLFEEASAYDSKYTKEAAELFRRVKELSHALYLNSNMRDNVEKLKQKIAIYVSRKEFEKIVALKDDLNRYGMLKDDNIRYALAYAFYMIKDYEHAEEQLKQINDSELFAKATVIRQNIEKCKEKKIGCM